MTIKHPDIMYFRNVCRRLPVVAALLCVLPLFAHDPAKYAANSALAEGNWGKVKVERTGIQFVSAASLRKMGFNDPTKVNAYGFGGRILPDELKADDPDDLPLLPTVKSAAGIWFFGHNHIRWEKSYTQLGFSHRMQPYAEESWYFISDRQADAIELPRAFSPATCTAETDVFTQTLLHENDIMHPSTSGRIYLGEDLRNAKTRKIDFTLTDKAADEFRFTVAAGTKTAKNSTLTVTPPAGTPTKVEIQKASNKAGDIDDKYYMIWASGTGKGESSSEQLSLELSYDVSGAVRFANLDYLELAYTRKLRLRDSQLYFPLYLNAGTRVTVSGAEAGMRIWDVTDHTRPLEVEFSRENNLARFNAPAGYHEYVAFVPEKGGYAATDPVRVENQNLHSLNTPDMLIISPAEYLSASNTLADHHREHDGFTVHVLTPEVIYNEFSSGTPDVGAFRRLLKMWYDRGKAPSADSDEPRGRIGYCLIMSRPTYDNKMLMEATRNAGYPRVPIWQSPNSGSGESSYPCDDVIAMLEDFEKSSDPMQPDSFNMDEEPVSIAIGRMPVTSADEARTVVKKYIDYVTAPGTGSWRNRIMCIADDKDRYDHFDQTESMISIFSKTQTANRFSIEKLYLDAYERVKGQTGNTFPEAKERMLRLWNEGVNIITYIGHANPVELTHEKLLEWPDIQSFSNKNLPFLYAATCEFARYDQDSPSGAEVLWSNPQGGIIATICPSRSVYIGPNGKFSNKIGTYLFDDSLDGKGARIGDILNAAKNTVGSDGSNKRRFVIVGDPAMRLRIPENVAEVTEIDGTATGSHTDDIVIPARGRAEIKGIVRNHDGVVDSDFNGHIEVVLYDSERVVETTPDPETDITRFFNDRSTILYRGITKVAAGEWSATLLLPEEIEGVYSNAKISLYAYSDKAREAHGYFSDFYVFGYNEDAPADDKGPEIHYFALNREDSGQGAVVHTSPVVMAKVSDESGINLSSLGIGHQITLTLDGRTYFDDVNSFYTPDSEDATAGTIMYPLPELEAGEHTLHLTVWDNANNSTSADLTFYVAASKTPEIYDLRTDVNPARDNVTFTLSTDRPMAKVECRIEVFDLNGRRIWVSERAASTDILASISVPWNLCTDSGLRVPRGIYLYRATVTSPDGTSATRSRKLAVTAQ